MLTYGFYNSVNGDRKYNASQMSSMFDGIIKDGVFVAVGDKLKVLASSGMNITVGTGRAWFNHTWTNNDALLPLTVQQSEVVLNRIDTVVVEVNCSDAVRANTIKIIKGTPASSPVQPTLTNDTYIHQYPLCNIYVAAGASQITQANITSRIGTVDCPYVTGIIEGIDLTVLQDKVNKNIIDTEMISKTYPCTGTANSLIVDTDGTFDLLTDGNILNIIPCSTNTGAVTLTVDGQSAKSIKKFNATANQYEDVYSSDITKNQQFSVRWDVSNNCFVMVISKLQKTSQAEAEAGTDDVKYTSSANVKQSIIANTTIGKPQTVTLDNAVKKGQKIEVYNNAGVLRGKVLKGLKDVVRATIDMGTQTAQIFPSKSGKHAFVLVIGTGSYSIVYAYKYTLINNVWVQQGSLINYMDSGNGGNGYNGWPNDVGYIEELDAWVITQWFKGSLSSNYFASRTRITKWDGTTFKDTVIWEDNSGYTGNIVSWAKPIKNTTKVIGASLYSSGSTTYSGVMHGYTISETASGFTAAPMTNNGQVITGVTSYNINGPAGASFQFGKKLFMGVGANTTTAYGLCLLCDTTTNVVTYSFITYTSASSSVDVLSQYYKARGYRFAADNKVFVFGFYGTSGIYFKATITDTVPTAASGVAVSITTGDTIYKSLSDADSGTVALYNPTADTWTVYNTPTSTAYTISNTGAYTNNGSFPVEIFGNTSSYTPNSLECNYAMCGDYLQYAHNVFPFKYYTVSSNKMTIGSLDTVRSLPDSKFYYATEDKASGNTVVVPIDGVIESSGLQLLKDYKFSKDGLVAGTEKGIPIGYAISDTKILLTGGDS